MVERTSLQTIFFFQFAANPGSIITQILQGWRYQFKEQGMNQWVWFDRDLLSFNLGALDGEGGGVLVEAVLTFVLVFTVFATAIDPRGMGNLAPLAIGLAVLVDHFVGVPLTGASMNPARSFGPALVADVWDNHWVYWVGPLAGGGIAALAYYLTFMWGRDEA